MPDNKRTELTGYGYLALSDFTPETRLAIVNYWKLRNWEEIETNSLILPEFAALMWFRLRAAPDEIFPRGKWATLQHLESLIEKLMETCDAG